MKRLLRKEMAQQQPTHSGTTPSSTGHKQRTQVASGPDKSVIKGRVVSCDLTDIKVFCEHHEAAPKPPAAATPPPAKKPGGLREAKEEGAEKEEGKKTEGAASPTHPSAPTPRPAAPAVKPSAQHSTPAAPVVKALVLDVIPHAAEAEAPPTKKPFSFGLGEISFSQGAPTAGDHVTLKAVMSSHCSLHPQWKITEINPSANNKPVGPMVPLNGVQVTYQFLPHTIPKQIWWLEDIKPRCYEVKCVVHDKATTAHNIVYVNVYPFVQAELKLTSESTKTPKNGWEKALAEARNVVEEVFKEIAELVPEISKAKLKILEGELTLSNTWKENEEENTNLAHWQADVEAELTVLSIEGNIDITGFSFLRKAKEAVEKFEHYFTSATGVGIEAGMYIIPSAGIKIAGKGSWESGKPPHPEGLDISGVLGLEFKAELKATYKRDGELADISGGGKTELTITGKPQLGSGPKLWVDTELSWNPLHIKLEAKLQTPQLGAGKKAPGGKLTPEQVQNDDKEGKKVGPSYEKDVFAIIKRKLGRITLLSGDTGVAQPAQTPPARH